MESQALFTALIHDPAFRTAASDIVIEFGNARHQDVADRFVRGDAVPREQVEKIWQDTTQISGIWSLPMYEQMLAEVRSVNATLPPAQRLRVWLGDPPIDWSVVSSGADEDMNDWRDAHFATVVQRIRARSRKVLVFVGGGHIGRKVIFPNSLIHLLDARLPGQTFVVSVIDASRVEPAVATRLREWRLRSAASVKGTWLGRLDVQQVGFRFSTGTVEEDVDAVVLLSHAPLVSLPAPQPDTATPPTTPYGQELQRRRDIARATMPFRGARIRFEADQTTLSPDAQTPLEEVLAELLRDRTLTLLVKAFADANERDPRRLSEQRATLLVDWLSQHGVARGRLMPKGCGAMRPLTFSRTAEDRAMNRRAELVRLKPTAACQPPW